MNGADVGMVQRRCRLRLALEAGERLRISGQLVRQELESDEAVEARVFRFVDHAHTASAQLLDYAIVRDGLANHEERGSGGRMVGRESTEVKDPGPDCAPGKSDARR